MEDESNNENESRWILLEIQKLENNEILDRSLLRF